MDDAALEALERRIDDVGMATPEDAHALIADLRAYKKAHVDMLAVLIDEARTREYRRALAERPAPLGIVDARFVGARIVETR